MRPPRNVCRCGDHRDAHKHQAHSSSTHCVLCPCRRYHRWWPWPRSPYRERDLNDLTRDDTDPHWPALRDTMRDRRGRDLADRLRVHMPDASDAGLAGMLADLRAATRTATEEMLGDLDGAIGELTALDRAEVPHDR